MDTLKNVVFIYEQRPFALALQRALRDTAEVQLFPKEKKWNLDSANTTHSTVIILDTDYEEEISEEAKEIQEWLWVIIRGKLKLRSPFICLGFEDCESFINNPLNLVFKDRRLYEYKYLKKPFLLKDLKRILERIEPLCDEYTITEHIQRFSGVKELVTVSYFHDLNNGIFRKDLETCKNCINNIKYLIQNINNENFENLKRSVCDFLQNPCLDLAKFVSKEIGNLRKEFHQ